VLALAVALTAPALVLAQQRGIAPFANVYFIALTGGPPPVGS
jgi:hypothetical protein